MNAPWPISGRIIAGTDAAAALFSGRFAEGRESMWIAHLDDEARCIHLAFESGSEQAVQMSVRDILIDAVRLGSRGLVIAHNHPSGDPSPSDDDIRQTKRLAAAAEAIDLTILDHLVFGGSDFRSFRRMGLL